VQSELRLDVLEEWSDSLLQSLLHRSCHKFTQRRFSTNDLEKNGPASLMY
jgi:hypothetical protein